MGILKIGNEKVDGWSEPDLECPTLGADCSSPIS
jgi:hypothetical protein